MLDVCSVCGQRLAGSSEKALKQHQKSRAHKAALKNPATLQTNQSILFETGTVSQSQTLPCADEELMCQVFGIVASCFPQSSVTQRQLYLSSCTARQRLVICAPPPLIINPKDQLHRQQPFITLQSGSVGVVPNCLEDSLAAYCNPGAPRLPNVDVQGCNQSPQTWSAAAKCLQLAQQDGSTYWVAFVGLINHPRWWPKSGHVPTYNQIICGSGATDIGIHTDVDNYLGTRNAITTYLTAARGSKRVILLPPEQTLYDKASCPVFPDVPTKAVVQAIVDAGGYFFTFSPLDPDTTVTMFVPKGWHHWLLGLTDWHVVFSGSVY